MLLFHPSGLRKMKADLNSVAKNEKPVQFMGDAGISQLNNSRNGGISVIVPSWDYSEQTSRLASAWAAFPGVREVIVCTTEAPTVPTSKEPCESVKVCWSEKIGRGFQMNRGAEFATGEVLLFHHADSFLTEAHADSITRAMNNVNIIGGAFYRKFDDRHPHLRWLEGLERFHSRLFGTLYGDQSIFVRHSHFKRLGGFARIPLMEDVEFSKRLRRSGNVALLDPPMHTSAQKHRAEGAWKVTLQNLLFLIFFRCGVPPARLHKWYYSRQLKMKEHTKTMPLDTNPMTGLMQTPEVRRDGRWQKRWDAFLNPINPEKLRILRERWNAFPEQLKTPNQISGRHLTHCGFILGASYCSFHCTHCYLPKNANQVPIPSLEEVKEQIDANRRFQGPGGGLQITGGDVADAYWKSGRVDELVEIIRYAYAVGLVPMLMTHGQNLLEQPQFLEKLMIEGGLRQVSVHIDVTQAGRHGYPINRVRSESDLHPVREAFTRLALDLREKTGLPLEFALSFTVTRKNINDVPEVIRWYLADPERTLIWRMMSFQPEADTGRTVFSENPVTPEIVWQKICEGTGLPLEKNGTMFGHPDCNSWASILVSRRTGKYLPLLPTDTTTKRLLGQVLEKIGGLSLVTDDAGTPPWRLAGVLARNPYLAVCAVFHLTALFASGRMAAGMIGDLLGGRIHTLGVGTHNFMDAAKVARADTDPVVRARLDACVFKGAVKQDGEWQAVPMCQMNQQKWSEVYDARLRDPLLRKQKQVPAMTSSNDSED